ncbi:MAG: SAM-dependent methyltransferase, partial [Clostridiales bacterium]|nr:SAM-dependent methyltransferase [Clostridiales bacterium]
MNKKRINLTSRLEAIAEMVENCRIVADVGCDHGRLAVSLLQREKAEFMLASDISPASVKKTEILAKKCGFLEKMQITHANGLDAILGKSVDAIIIAGMGGILISEILCNGVQIAQKAERIIMQPMRGDKELRQYLFENGYNIIDERLVFEDRRAYPIICARYSGTHDIIPNFFPEDYFEVSYYLAKKRDKNLHRHLLVLKERLMLNIQNAGLNSEYEFSLKSINKILQYYNQEGENE